MSKNSLVSIFCLAVCMLFVGTCTYAESATNIKYRYNNIPVKQPVASKSMLPAIAKYKQGNYVGAMVDLKEVLEKEENNTYAKYYLALCYTQLGYKGEAQKLYREIAEKGDNFSLRYYSKKAATCIDNPLDEVCLPPKKVRPPEIAEGENGENKEVDDITKFIQSGKQIHPNAMDKITRDRMERKLQADAYSKKQAEEAKNGKAADDADTTKSSSAAMPTNEEIVAALDVLSKVGLNPLTQLNKYSYIPVDPYSQFEYNNQYDPMYNLMLSNGSLDSTKMMMFAQMAQQNSFLNYGI